MTGGEQTPPGSGTPGPGDVGARYWGPPPRRWVPDAAAAARSGAPAEAPARRSALTPLPADEDDTTPRRSALTPGEADETVPRRSALTPGEDEPEDSSPRRSALSPGEDDDAPRSVRWSGEYASAPGAHRSALTPGDTDEDSAPRRSALTPGDDTEPEAEPRRYAVRDAASGQDPPSGGPTRGSDLGRRSALTPLPDDEVTAPRAASRYAETPSSPDDPGSDVDEVTVQLPLPRHSSEYAAAQPALPRLSAGALGVEASAPAVVDADAPVTAAENPDGTETGAELDPDSPPPPDQLALPGEVPDSVIAATPSWPAVRIPVFREELVVPETTSHVNSASDTPALRDEPIVPGTASHASSTPGRDVLVFRDERTVPETASPGPSVPGRDTPTVRDEPTVPKSPGGGSSAPGRDVPGADAPADPAPAVASAPPAVMPPAVSGRIYASASSDVVPTISADLFRGGRGAPLGAAPEGISPDLFRAGPGESARPAPPPTVSETTGSLWSIGPDYQPLDEDTHALYRRPLPGEPETEVDMTPVVIEQEPARRRTSPPASSPDSADRSRQGRPARVRATRGKASWRDHRRLLLVGAIVLALLIVVGTGGYLLSRSAMMNRASTGPLTLPLAAGDYRRDPSAGSSPSTDPGSNTQTVSATYTLDGDSAFVAIAYRPQTSPQAALAEIGATNVTKAGSGACGRAADQNRQACAVISGTTAVLVVTLSDQTTDALIDAATKVANGLGT